MRGTISNAQDKASGKCHQVDGDCLHIFYTHTYTRAQKLGLCLCRVRFELSNDCADLSDLVMTLRWRTGRHTQRGSGRKHALFWTRRVFTRQRGVSTVHWLTSHLFFTFEINPLDVWNWMDQYGTGMRLKNKGECDI